MGIRGTRFGLTQLTRIALARCGWRIAERSGQDNGAGVSFFKYAMTFTHTSWGRGLTGILSEVGDVDGQCKECGVGNSSIAGTVAGIGTRISSSSRMENPESSHSRSLTTGPLVSIPNDPMSDGSRSYER